MNIKKYFFVFLILLPWLLVPSLSRAAASDYVDPQFNPMCWQEADCEKARVALFMLAPDQAKKGFLAGAYPCSKSGWGKCLPAGTTATEVSFGGKTQFTDIGDYISTVYTYALRIAAILAVIMIIIAGVQYVTSGGNSEMISSAKKRITGSLIGLFIAYMSYFILNSINPNLVNLRLPQVSLIKPQVLTSEFCSDIPITSNVMLAEAPTSLKFDSSPLDVQKASVSDGDYKVDLKTTMDTTAMECGKTFVIKDSGGHLCQGDFCDPEKGKKGICLKGISANKDQPYGCVPGINAAGKVYNSDYGDSSCEAGIIAAGLSKIGILSQNAAEGWVYPWVSNNMLIISGISQANSSLLVACNDGASKKAGDIEVFSWGTELGIKLGLKKDVAHTHSGESFYELKIDSSDIGALGTFCEGGHQGLKGYALYMLFDEDCDPTDEIHVIGKGGIDLGNVDRSALFGDNTMQIFGTGSGSKEKAAKLRKVYFFTADQIKRGIRLNIDAGIVTDIDEEADMQVYNKLMDQ